VFSGTKQVATDRRASLGLTLFEELTILKSTWGPNVYDAAAWNAAQVEEVSLLDFKEMLVDDADTAEWDKDQPNARPNDNSFELVI
jgi:hypothetical protein